MDFKEIDEMFESAARRLKAGVDPTAGYGEPPLASDHYLLRRSWEFFQKRLKAVEDQWADIARAKDDEIQALKKDAAERGRRLADAEGRVSESDEIDRVLEMGRLGERREFDSEMRKLQDRWEGEREALERQVAAADLLSRRLRKEAESRLETMAAEVRELRESLEKARIEIGHQSEKRLSGESLAAETLLKRDELIRSLESKVDLLRSELDRRDMVFRQTAERLQALSHDHQRLIAEQNAARGEVHDAEQRASALEERLKASKQENEELKAARRREQSEWRELWERAREMWDKERAAGERRPPSSTEND